MIIDQRTLHTICSAFHPTPPEAGGILGSIDGCVCAFAYDPGVPDLLRNCYTPDVDLLNRTIARWQTQGIMFCGIVHSHPPGQHMLSEGDMIYIQTIMDSLPEQISELFFPIVIHGEGLFPFVVRRGNIVALDYIIITKEI